MDTDELLTTTFATHESDAPDVTATRLAIEAELARRSGRPPVLATAATVAVVAAVATAAFVIRGGEDTGRRSLDHAPGAGSHTARVAPRTHGPATWTSDGPSAAATFPFRPGWLPPGATFDSAEVGEGRYRVEGFTFGNVPSQVRGLTLWSLDGPLPTRLRDGGVLHTTTVDGRPAVEGWSPGGHSYTVAVLRPHNLVMTVLAYGWTRETASEYARHTVRDMHYGRFPTPHGTR